METAVSGSQNGNADAIAHKATNHRVRLVSFGGVLQCRLTNHNISFTSKIISRHDEGSEVALLSKTRNKIFLLLGFLMGGQHLHSLLVTWIQNIISERRPEILYKKSTMIITCKGNWWQERQKRRTCSIHDWVPVKAK